MEHRGQSLEAKSRWLVGLARQNQVEWRLADRDIDVLRSLLALIPKGRHNVQASVGDVAAEAGCSVATARRALRHLADCGVIRIRAMRDDDGATAASRYVPAWDRIRQARQRGRGAAQDVRGLLSGGLGDQTAASPNTPIGIGA